MKKKRDVLVYPDDIFDFKTKYSLFPKIFLQNNYFKRYYFLQ